MKYDKLKKPWEFDRVYRDGNKWTNDLFMVCFLPNNDGKVRIGLTVTKKVGKSVKRNRVKRLIREVLRLTEETLPAGDMVIVAKKESADMNYWQAWDSINSLIRRIRGLKE